MKKAAWAILIAILLTPACRDSGNIRIRGTYSAGSGQTLYIELLNAVETVLLDSVKVKNNGTFRFNLRLDNPELVLLKNANENYINLLAFPGDDIQLEVPGNSFRNGYSIEGSEDSKRIKLLIDALNITRFKIDSISDALAALENQEGPAAEELIIAYQRIFEQHKRNNIRFIVGNLGSLVSVYALYQRITDDIYIFNDPKDLQYFKIVADSVKAKYPGSTLTKALSADVERRMKEYNNLLALYELSKLNISEAGMIDLNIENTDAEKVSLNSLTGKVVLLNFWASWNNESMNFNHRLKPIYEQYHARGFEIYSVSLDGDRSKWKKTIFFEEYPWINVCELTYPYSYAATVYNVTSLPGTFLIDRKGNIVARNIGGKSLATHLDNLL